MKAKKGFNIRKVCGENIIVAEGEENIDFSNIISMNESSAFLWNNINGKDSFTVDELVDNLLGEYEVDEATARRDVEALVDNWRQAGIIEE
ncbi:PqqD family protein [Segatella buccae]|jgi:hypothetical protein|uniref:PqqD family protein n=1 Tax=Segatella buccae TaxID=28126 RepID=UPI0022E6730F|nr:PqqD family protein [Segatella buccae]